MLTIKGLIVVISLVLTAFGVGYAIGSKSQKKPPPAKVAVIFSDLNLLD